MAGEKDCLLRQPMSINTLKAVVNEERRQTASSKLTSARSLSAPLLTKNSGSYLLDEDKTSKLTSEENKLEMTCSYPNSCESSPENTEIMSSVNRYRSQFSSQVNELLKAGDENIPESSGTLSRTGSFQERIHVSKRSDVELGHQTVASTENPNVEHADLSDKSYSPRLRCKQVDRASTKNKLTKAGAVFKQLQMRISTNKK